MSNFANIQKTNFGDNEIPKIINNGEIPKKFFSFRKHDGIILKVSNEFIIKLFIDCADRKDLENFKEKIESFKNKVDKINLIDRFICLLGEQLLNVEFVS